MILPTEVAPALCVNAYLFFGPARRMSSAKASLQIRMLRMWKSIVRRFTFATFLKFWAWTATAVAVVFVSAGLFLLFVSDEQWSRVLPAASGAVAAAGVFLALTGHLFTQARDVSEARDKRSFFYLESCIKAYDEARELLADGNNDRATWIAAGRALGHAKALSKDVKQDAHVRVLELHRLKYRSFFAGCLTDKTAAFFYGAKDPSESVDKAAGAHTAPTKRAGRTVSSTINALETKSIHAVWEAAQWPDPYEDPLGTDFTAEEKWRLIVLFPGLHEYLEHMDTYASASGNVFRRKER
jgi:hypothetical protein